jgi:hypothetical protein
MSMTAAAKDKRRMGGTLPRPKRTLQHKRDKANDTEISNSVLGTKKVDALVVSPPPQPKARAQ